MKQDVKNGFQKVADDGTNNDDKRMALINVYKKANKILLAAFLLNAFITIYLVALMIIKKDVYHIVKNNFKFLAFEFFAVAIMVLFLGYVFCMSWFNIWLKVSDYQIINTPAFLSFFYSGRAYAFLIMSFAFTVGASMTFLSEIYRKHIHGRLRRAMRK